MKLNNSDVPIVCDVVFHFKGKHRSVSLDFETS